MANPFLTTPWLMDRNTQYAHVTVRTDPNVAGYTLWTYYSPNDAYGAQFKPKNLESCLMVDFSRFQGTVVE